MQKVTSVLIGLALSLVGAPCGQAQDHTWKFAVSGDSRNCGDVVMPAIAAGVRQSGAKFYWHLGDLRAIFMEDEDIAHQPEHLAKPLTKDEYQAMAWYDFRKSQMNPFGRIPFFLGMGNHETIAPKDHAAFVAEFSRELDTPKLRAQRRKDDPADLRPTSYYHWIERGVDFFNLDNATGNDFGAGQVDWFEKVLRRDAADPKIRTFVIGMHEALPESISKDHAMDQSPGGIESGLRVYHDLLDVQSRGRQRVYVLASHSHYYMEDTFNTDYWHAHGGVLPGWIVGTAGAELYDLPGPEAGTPRDALQRIYGYLVGTVHGDGEIRFDFHRLGESDVPAAVTSRYTPDFVDWCFTKNVRALKKRDSTEH